MQQEKRSDLIENSGVTPIFVIDYSSSSLVHSLNNSHLTKGLHVHECHQVGGNLPVGCH